MQNLDLTQLGLDAHFGMFSNLYNQHDTFPLTRFQKTIPELGFLSQFGYSLSFRLYLILTGGPSIL
jgi:hypothetical protein